MKTRMSFHPWEMRWGPTQYKWPLFNVLAPAPIKDFGVQRAEKIIEDGNDFCFAGTKMVHSKKGSKHLIILYISMFT